MGSGASLISGSKAPTEKQAKAVFSKYDTDASGTVDEQELMIMLDELKLSKPTEAENAAFLEKMFIDGMAEADQNNDGKLTFPEFLVFVKYAHQTLNTKSKPKSNKIQVQGRDSKALSQETENARREIAEQKARDKAAAAAKLAEENRERQRRLKEAGSKGRDTKGLSSEVLAERKRIAEESEKEKAKHAKDQASANKEYEARLASQVGRDVKSLDADTEALRRRQSEESQKSRERNAADLAKQNADNMKRINSQTGRDEKSLSGETEANRKRVAEQSAQSKAEEAKRLSQENAAFQERVNSQVGRDEKSLSKEEARNGEIEAMSKAKDVLNGADYSL